MSAPPNARCGSSSAGNVLNFDSAMAHFSTMFPEIGASLIEAVLRKHDGDVSATIDELLRRSAAGEGCEEKAAMDGGEQPQRRATVGESNGNGNADRDPCADDEKIALLIQNREFLRYLRHQPHFQREMLGHSPSGPRHSHRALSHRSHLLPTGPSFPVLLHSSRASSSPNTRRLFQRTEHAQPIPDGPPVEFRSAERDAPIPEGPLIDYVDAEAKSGSSGGWTQRLKAKLSSAAEKKPPPGCEQIPPSPLVHYSDEQLRQGIQGMGRGGKGLLLGLAKRFLGGDGTQRSRVHLEPRPAEATRDNNSDSHGSDSFA